MPASWYRCFALQTRSRGDTGPESATARNPKYRAIWENLRRQILRGRFRNGDALPSQRELSLQFGVSLMTIRQALQVLQEEGLIEKRAGQGTYVTLSSVNYRLDGLRSFADELSAQATALTTRVLRIHEEASSPEVEEHLCLSPGEHALSVERLRIVDEVPLIHQVSYLPATFAPVIRNADLTEASLYELLWSRANVRATRATELIAPIALPAEAADALAQPAGSATIASRRITYDDRDRPIVYDYALFRGDRITFSTERIANDVKYSYHVSQPVPDLRP